MKPNKKKQNKKYYYQKAGKSAKRDVELANTMSGFFVTCDKEKERKCINELYNILSEECDQLYADSDLEGLIRATKIKKEAETNEQKIEEKPKEPEQKKVEDLEKEKKKDMNSELAEEIKGIEEKKYFFTFDTTCNGVLFIKIREELRKIINPHKVVENIIHQILEKKESKTRFTSRLIPISVACKADVAKFTELVEPFIKQVFLNKENITWRLEFKARNNSKIKKDDYMNAITKLIGSHHIVDVFSPEYTIMVEICKDLLCFSIIPHYKEYLKYNLQMLGQINLNEASKPALEEKKAEDTNIIENKDQVVQVQTQAPPAKENDKGEEDIKLI